MTGSKVVADFGAPLSCHVRADANKFADEGEVAWNVVSNCEVECCHKYPDVNAQFMEVRVQGVHLEATTDIPIINYFTKSEIKLEELQNASCSSSNDYLP